MVSKISIPVSRHVCLAGITHVTLTPLKAQPAPSECVIALPGQRGYTLTFWTLKLSKALDVLLFVICIANRLLYIYVSWTYYLPLTFMYVKGKFSLPERASM